ncbi:cytochrome b5 domain-containing protein [uncultured Clostridium sp.]|uniref:cytochrome b5 domain-containing protein n=1 Tax=uncultured Clostridium sp. TaxID=59620 RepID=UPI0028E880B3|nr:cytochrome b5 domain-containing protein [uncultured Clostridium sp.]
MNLKYCEELINRMKCNVYNLQSLRNMSINRYHRMYYENLIKYEKYQINGLENFLRNMRDLKTINEIYRSEASQNFTLQELEKYDGKGGNKAYVSVDGIVYDVTYNAAWAGGTHFGLRAGRDLSKEISSCHNKEEVLKELEKIGILKTEGSSGIA